MVYRVEETKLNGLVQPCVVVYHKDLTHSEWIQEIDWENDTVIRHFPKSKHSISSLQAEDEINEVLSWYGLKPVQLTA
jgi:hypothetical protein